MIDWRPVAEPCPRGIEFLAYDATTKKMDVCEWNERWKEIAPVQSDSEYGPSSGDFMGDIINDEGERINSVITHWAIVEPPT